MSEHSFRTNVVTGTAPLALSQNVRSWQKRDCYQDLDRFIHGPADDRVCLLFGLRRTGKMILLNLDNLSRVKKFLVDGGYSGERFASQVRDICGAQVEVVKRSELHKFVVLPRRWVVERLFGWLDKFRRLWKNCERKLFISAQILSFALIAILIRRFKQTLKAGSGK